MANRAAKDITRISATGNKFDTRAGFTLIELLVVVAIMSIVLGVAVRTISDNRPAYMLRQETSRLHAVFRFAADDAILHGRQWGLLPEPTRYRFVYFDPDSHQWLDTTDTILAKHELPETLEMKLEAVNNLALPGAAQNALRPPVLLLSSGITSAFTLNLHDRGDARLTASLTTDGRSNIIVSEGNEKKP